MEDIVKRTKAYLQRKGLSTQEIEKVVNFMQTTCVACKHSPECRAKGIVKEFHHPKCERHEFADSFCKSRSKF